MSIKIGSLFSGIGSLELGLERSIPNSETVWQVEQDKFCQSILAKHWPDAQLYNDVCDVGVHNLEPVDLICGGFPCQDIAICGKQGGIYGERSGLWWEMQRIISELRPRVVVVENVPNLYVLGMREVLGSMAEIGYDAEWTTISAAQCGAPHKRNRVWIVAYPTGQRLPRQRQCQPPINSKTYENWETSQFIHAVQIGAVPYMCRDHNGATNRVDKLKALGNSIVPQCSEWIGQQIINAKLLDF
tara:strand:- start:774 stop:1505 length:732 start_codon:yes stop_codon:yes gene_type:complete